MRSYRTFISVIVIINILISIYSLIVTNCQHHLTTDVKELDPIGYRYILRIKKLWKEKNYM